MAIASRALLAISMLLLPGLAGAASFGARYDQSRWESRRDGDACLLSHPIPRFGLALFSQDQAGALSLAVFADRPPSEEGTASLIGRNPDWKPAQAHRLDAARLRADSSLARFSHYNAQRVLSELEQGQEAVLRFDGWWSEGATEVALSPINFRAALRAHLDCLAGLPRPPVGELAAGPDPRAYRASASAPTRTGPGSADGAANEAANAIYFASDDAGLDRPAMDTLRRFATRLRDQPAARVVIGTGHADPRGGADYNRRLGERRARSVRDYLLELGLDPRRIEVASLGEQAPASEATDSYGLAQSRRVLLELR